MKLILASAQDPAAKNIAARLLELYDFEKSSTLPNSYIYDQVLLALVPGGVTQLASLPVDADEVIVASRHASESGKPSLTAHVSGELEKRKLAVTSPQTIKTALQALVAARDELGLPHEVSLEATHHGPTKLDVPVTFVEIGSSSEQWVDKKAGEAVARAIIAVASPAKCRNAVGLGGPHYAPRHTEVTLRTDVGVGHILPKYARIDEELLEQAIVRTSGGVELLALDWKGTSGEQRAICQTVADRLGIRVQRCREILAQAKV
ncbi:MAG: D-aminoacyl-tRNA deacylase [Candidatus Hodarchaeaceae archaeon]|nr:D-aminoacyl-tRNA deacylase [Candidatus Hodarchaeaceae archaeon]